MDGNGAEAGVNDARFRLLLQLRQAGVSNSRVLNVIESIPRELFTPRLFLDHAYDNVALPIGHHQTISQPEVVGLMTEALRIGDRMKVLEIGTGSGYQAAVLAKLCRRLYTIERHAELLAEAESRFTQLRLHNITTLAGDGTKGWPAQAPFERIMITAAAHDIPGQLIQQLAVGGIMVLPVGEDAGEQQIVRVTRTDDGAETEYLSTVRFVPLISDEDNE
ncbi:MAG: protein-L-isoaspartate(D-aspartate) O-methyltransferase [Rhodospirillales bacterium]|nr:protein-L-isoaspartate(D-aspartate) O-methyltransferase [Rhodospirillales bacterium]